MTPETAPDDKKAIRLVLEKINNAWLKGRAEDIPAALRGCLHDDVVMMGPEFQQVAKGREALVKGYADFVRQATIRECRLGEPQIDLAGDTAVAVYHWDMVYELNGQEFKESGHDLFVFSRIGGRWQAVWRAMLPSPPKQ